MSIDLKKIYKKIDDFILDINLEIKAGELISLLGPSGCGKTTTLRIIAGFETAHKGRISIHGNDITDLPPEKRNVGMVFQDYALFPHMTVKENICYGPKIRKWSKERTNKALQKFLKIVHLEDLVHRKVTNLSGGEQQRVALARALITEPTLLLLDEPLSALDAKLRQKLRGEIRRIQKELSITTIYVTHDQEEALAISDKIAVMNKGQCIQFDTPSTIYREPQRLFSASFIGQSNIIEIKDQNIQGETCLVDTDLGQFEVNHILKKSDVKPFLFFRPEHCYICSETDDSNVFKGIILSEEYGGTHSTIEVNCNEHMIKSIVYGPLKYSIGDEVFLAVHKNNCRIIW